MARTAADMTTEEFDRILGDILDEEAHFSPGRNLLSIPGVYEAVSEHFNNDVIERWLEEL